MVKVLALAADHDGCFQYRVRLPAEAAQRRGFDISYDHDVDVEATQNSKTGIVTVAEVLTDAEVVSIQRPVTQRMHELAVAVKRQGIGLVVDIDDDLAMLPKHNASHALLDPVKNPLNNWVWLEKTAALADIVTVSTASLLRYGQPGAGRVVYNAVDPAWLEIEPRLPAAIGWTGTLRTHRYDLHAVRHGLAGLEERASLHLISDEPYDVARALTWQGDVACAGWQSFDTYPVEIANKIGVGIVPLDLQDVFNVSKSFLKGLEFAALGIPFVASPSPQYQLLAGGYRIGETAKGETQWRRKVGSALERRDVLGPSYRARVAAEHTTDHTAGLWISAWEEAAAHVQTR